MGKRGKKRARREDPLIDILIHSIKEFGSLQTVACENIRRLVDCFQFEADSAARKMKIFEELKKIDGLKIINESKLGNFLFKIKLTPTTSSPWMRNSNLDFS